MSLAGARSSSGDCYQHYVALQYAVSVLLNTDDDQSIEVEATTLGPDGTPILVDDIILRRKNGKTRYIQCKKNSPDQREWTVANLRPELVKAAKLLVQDPNGEVIFHSHSGFGIFNSLRERLNQFPDFPAFEFNLPQALSDAFSTLVDIWQKEIPDCSRDQIYFFLRRIYYDSPLSNEQIDSLCHLGLGNAYASPDAALDALWGILTRAAAKQDFGGVAQSKHVFTREDLIEALSRRGFNRSPQRSEAEILDSFRQTSAMGRNWPRAIKGRKIPRAAQGLLLKALSEGVRSILVTDEPGSGKTCLLLDLVEHLEQCDQKGVLFIQGREFESCAREEDFVRAGLPENLPGLVERLANHRSVVVIIDSLDVLALARNHRPLQTLLRLVDRLLLLKRVTVIMACRTFDLKNEPSLSERTWERTLHIGPLDWDTEIVGSSLKGVGSGWPGGLFRFQ